MAIKKNELYSSLWASCDKLRGGMDASQYKDYILILLFVKYVTDKFKGDPYPDVNVPEGGSFDDMVSAKGQKDIGEQLDVIIGCLAENNSKLRGIINNIHFNDESKFGKGDEMVEKLTGLISIFQRPEFNFKDNKAGGDDILGDAYEYLMRNFATESGKSKGQFYTPAEVSRVLSKVIGIDKIEFRAEDYSIYDPACGSGSLLIRAADEAPFEVAIYGQEKEITTAGLAMMNLVLHNKGTGIVKAANTFSDPQYLDEKDNTRLKRMDFIVANPPFSLKNWSDGYKDYGRFEGYDTPPEKNGDFAWLLHILKSLKSTGKAAVILPHGVLFRGNAEASIRKTIVDKGYIKGIIGLPANLFYGTGIPACIIVIDKSDADERDGIFMIDASRDFIKDGNKNRLRERDIYKIVTTFNNRITDDPKYARFVPYEEIKTKNEYNLNIPRYIDSSVPEDSQDIDAHLNGGIPAIDIDTMQEYWDAFSGLKSKLFSLMRKGYYKLNIEKDDIRTVIYTDDEFSEYADSIDEAFMAWKSEVDKSLKNINSKTDVKEFIIRLAEILIEKYNDIALVDKYDVYEVLLLYWIETMSDDVFILKYDGYEAGKETENIVEVTETKKGERKEKIKGWEGKLIPKKIIERNYFFSERIKIDEAQLIVDETQRQFDAFIEENAAEGGVLFEYTIEPGKIDTKAVNARFKELKKSKADTEEYKKLTEYIELAAKIKEYAKLVKELEAALDEAEKEKYQQLSIDEVKMLLVDQKWYNSIFKGISELYSDTSHNMADRIIELAERYEDTLTTLENDVREQEARVRAHLERMGFSW